MSAQETRSPIKNLPVRMPGQSLREQFDTLFDDRVLPYLMVPACLGALALTEWIAVWMKSPRHPIMYTVATLVAVILAWVKIRSALREARDLNLGRMGEEAVGQYLDENLRPLGCQVLHDIPADGFNVDHLVVGPTGVFCVETKTHSKPAKGQCVVTYDGQKVVVNGHTPDRDPLVQATSTARWLSDLLVQTTGRRFFVQPLVLYPGWYIEQKVPTADIWVLNEKAAPGFIRNGRNPLSGEDISLITFHLKRYVIAKSKEKQA